MNKKIMLFLLVITFFINKVSPTYAQSISFINGELDPTDPNSPIVEIGANLVFADDEAYVIVNLWSLDGNKNIIKDLKIKNPNGTGGAIVKYLFKKRICGDYSFGFYNSDGSYSSVAGTQLSGVNGWCSEYSGTAPTDKPTDLVNLPDDMYTNKNVEYPIGQPINKDGTANNSSGGGSGGDDGNGGSSDDDCPECKIFECPSWSDYMSKMDSIKNSIPPAPDWDKVADKFRDSIVPKVINDLRDMLGSAPSEPATPTQPPDLDDHNIKNSNPTMNDIPDMDKAQFNEDRIKNESQNINTVMDPTGGFNIMNPIDSLPSFPTDKLPEPGNTDSGDWFHPPGQSDTPFPDSPKDTGDTDTSGAPKPSDGGSAPPSPDDNNGNVPIPDGNNNPPNPNGGGGDTGGMYYYKPKPESADGSGGEYN